MLLGVFLWLRVAGDGCVKKKSELPVCLELEIKTTLFKAGLCSCFSDPPLGCCAGIFAFKCSRAEEIFNLLQDLMQCNSINVVEEPVVITRNSHPPERELSRTPQAPNSEALSASEEKRGDTEPWVISVIAPVKRPFAAPGSPRCSPVSLCLRMPHAACLFYGCTCLLCGILFPRKRQQKALQIVNRVVTLWVLFIWIKWPFLRPATRSRWLLEETTFGRIRVCSIPVSIRRDLNRFKRESLALVLTLGTSSQGSSPDRLMGLGRGQENKVSSVCTKPVL